MSAKKSQRRPAESPKPGRGWRPRRPRLLIALAVCLMAALYAAWPKPHGWRTLGPGAGRIRWVETRTDALVEHPLAPDWVRSLRKKGIPWPTDLPTEPLGASFGGGEGEHTSAWYLIQSARPTQQLWHVDKESLRITDAAGVPVEWPGGTGSVLADAHRRLQLLYIGVPPELSHKGAHLRFRLSRFADDGTAETRTEEVELPL